MLRTEDGDNIAFNDHSDTTSNDLRFYIYPFATTFQGTIPLPCKATNCGLTLADDQYSKRSYVTDISPNTSATTILKGLKATRRKLRGAYVTEINGTPVFTSADISKQLQHLQEQGGGKKISITFGMEPNLSASKLRKAVDDFFLLAPATTKAKKRQARSDALDTADDGTPRLLLGTKLYKVFDSKEYEGKVVSYDMDAALYKVLYEDGDEEEMYHNELKAHLKPTKKAKHRRSKPLNRIISKFAPNELDEDHHTLELNANTIRAIASIKYGDQITHSDVSDELIRLYTLGSDSVTPEEAQLGHFYPMEERRRRQRHRLQ